MLVNSVGFTFFPIMNDIPAAEIKLGKNYYNTANNDYEEEKDDKREDNAGLFTFSSFPFVKYKILLLALS